MPRIRYLGNDYPLRTGETVLDALLRGGVDMRFSCRNGSCGVCVLRGLQGDTGDSATGNPSRQPDPEGHFRPCVCRPQCDLKVAPPARTLRPIRATITDRRMLAPDILRLTLRPDHPLAWSAGQYVYLRPPGKPARAYSIAGSPDRTGLIELHVRRWHEGRISRWLHDIADAGDDVELLGPHGEMVWHARHRQQPILLLATGTGVAPIAAILRAGLAAGHAGPIRLFHGVRMARDLYLDHELKTLAAAHPNVEYIPVVSGPDRPSDARPGRITEAAFPAGIDLHGTILFAAGHPDMVYDARAAAVAAGIDRRDISTDPFLAPELYMPDDRAKLARVKPNPELWSALGGDDGLRAILEDFYHRVYEDPQLAPFFHNVTRARAIEKQHEFLASVFTGGHVFFGMRPFNAHHWMVISDELFDYREALMEDCIRRSGLAEEHVRWWLAFQEMFRREIVKSAPRGIVEDGVESLREGFTLEVIDVATLCDGCGGEVDAGERIRLHNRTGKLYCMDCSATAPEAGGEEQPA